MRCFARLVAVVVVAGTPLLAATDMCRAGAAPAPGITPTLVWSRTFPGVGFQESSPTIANLASPAVVVGGLDGRVYAFDAATGADQPGWPVATTNPIESSPAAAAVAGGSQDQVFVGSGQAATSVGAACSGGGTYAIDPNGAVRWHHIGSDAVCPNQAFHSSFAIGDLTGSGTPDAVIGALGLQSPAYKAATGALDPGWPFFTNDTVFSSPALQDVTGSGVADVLMGGDATPGPNNFRGGMMRAIDGGGHLIWQFKVDEQVRSSPAVGVIGGSGAPSVVFGTGNFWLQHGGAADSTSLFALDLGGRLKWRQDLGGVTQAAPALADVTGSGAADVVEGTTGSPGNPNGGLIWVLDGNGKALPNWAGRTSDGGVVIGGIATADLNGDGVQDLLVPTGAGVFLYDGRTAQQIGGLDIGKVGFQNTPLVTDDGGSVGITVAGTQPDGVGVVQHWRVAGGQLGAVGWHMFRHDPRHTGNMATVFATPACRPAAAAVAPTGKVQRVWGSDRDGTAVAVSAQTFPAAGSARAVVLASNASYPDALAGAPLAFAKGGPILITPSAALDAAVGREIVRVLPPGQTVYILGGPAAVDPSVDSQLGSMGYVVQRVQGADRFATAVAIAHVLGDPTTVFEVTGFAFPDALSAGAAAAVSNAAVLLTNDSVAHPTTAAYLAAHPGSRYAVGGPASRADTAATALVGKDRYETAIAVAKVFFATPPAVAFASGAGFADALAGGPAAAVKSAPLVLVPPCGNVPASVTDFLKSAAPGVSSAVLFGGPGAIGDDVLSQVSQQLP